MTKICNHSCESFHEIDNRTRKGFRSLRTAITRIASKMVADIPTDLQLPQLQPQQQKADKIINENNILSELMDANLTYLSESIRPHRSSGNDTINDEDERILSSWLLEGCEESNWQYSNEAVIHHHHQQLIDQDMDNNRLIIDQRDYQLTELELMFLSPFLEEDDHWQYHHDFLQDLD